MDVGKAVCWVVIVVSVPLAAVLLFAERHQELITAQAHCKTIHGYWDDQHTECLGGFGLNGSPQVIRP